MNTKDLMARLQAKYPYEKEYLQAVHEVLESIEEVYNQHPEFEELEDREVYRRMETDTALVRSDSRVELYSVTCVCLNLTVIVNPCNLESKDTLWLYDTLNDLSFLELRMLVIDFLYRLQYFMYRLEILFLIRVLGLEFGHQIISVHYYVF